MNGADAQRLQRQLVEKERELRKLRSEREEEIRAAIEATELQVRGEMVKEIRERRLNGEKEEDVLDLAGLRASYEAVERQLRSQLASQLAEKDREIEELCQQIQYLETDVSRLQERVELLSSRAGEGVSDGQRRRRGDGEAAGEAGGEEWWAWGEGVTQRCWRGRTRTSRSSSRSWSGGWGRWSCCCRRRSGSWRTRGTRRRR